MPIIKEFDGLRWLMALWVYVAHVLFLSGLRESRILKFLSEGGNAVTVFIVLSGFAIATSLLRSRGTYRDYIAKRFFRIYPIYVVALILGIWTSHLYTIVLQSLAWSDQTSSARIVARTAGEESSFIAHLVAHLTLLHGAVPDDVLYGASLSFNGPLWSLSLEWQFYLVAPLMVAILVVVDKRWLSVLALISLGILSPGLLGKYFDQVPSFLPLRILFFAVGILTAIHLDHLRRDPKLVVAAAILLLLSSRELIPVLIWCVAVGSVCWFGNPLARGVGVVLKNPVMAYLGERSYGFYAIHFPILLAWAYALIAMGFTSNRVLFAGLLLITLPVTIGIAALSYRYFELPINQWAKRRFSGKRPAGTPTPQVRQPA